MEQYGFLPDQPLADNMARIHPLPAELLELFLYEDPIFLPPGPYAVLKAAALVCHRWREVA